MNLRPPHSEETKARMRAAQQLRRATTVVSAETRAKQSAALKGKPKSDAARAAMSAAKKGKPGRKQTEAEIATFVARTKARVVLAESREKMRQAKLGKPGPWTGKKRGPHSPEWRAAIGAGNKGKIASDEKREKLRLARLGKPAHHGRRCYYKGITFRSTYEIRVARALDARYVIWNYEPRRFDLGTCTYCIDFYLPDYDVYLEVKGWYGPDTAKKICLFRKLFPEVPFMLVMLPEIKRIEDFEVGNRVLFETLYDLP